MRRLWLTLATIAGHLILLAALTTGCEAGGRSAAFVIPGPAGPSEVPTALPYLWDTRDELSIWMHNPVARGSLALEGSGLEAFLRIDRADREWLLRGPDFTPPATGVRTLSIRYRWRPDPGLGAGATRTLHVTAHFQTSTPMVAYDPNAQAAASSELQPQDDWTEVTLIPGQFRPPIEVEYCYVHSFGANRGVLEIDRIELVR
jgi:hypothetical protein